MIKIITKNGSHFQELGRERSGNGCMYERGGEEEEEYDEDGECFWERK